MAGDVRNAEEGDSGIGGKEEEEEDEDGLVALFGVMVTVFTAGSL